MLALGLFWLGWAASAVGLFIAPALTVLGLVGTAVAFPAGLVFYATLYAVREPAAELPGQRRLSTLGFRRTRVGLLDLLRPRRIRHTLRNTGWPVAFVGYGLLALLVVDLLLFAVMFRTD